MFACLQPYVSSEALSHCLFASASLGGEPSPQASVDSALGVSQGRMELQLVDVFVCIERGLPEVFIEKLVRPSGILGETKAIG